MPVLSYSQNRIRGCTFFAEKVQYCGMLYFILKIPLSTAHGRVS